MQVTKTKTGATENKNSESSSQAEVLQTEQQVRMVREAIRDVPDYPKPGILFRDITPALSDAKVFGAIIDMFTRECRKLNPTSILGIEARGFVIGAAVAARMGVGFVPVRKPGKLPSKVYSAKYDLEYGSDEVQMHQDALSSSDRVVIIDDLLATGGTALATCKIVEQAGAKIESIVSLIELSFLPWREKLVGHKVKTFISYDN